MDNSKTEQEADLENFNFDDDSEYEIEDDEDYKVFKKQVVVSTNGKLFADTYLMYDGLRRIHRMFQEKLGQGGFGVVLKIQDKDGISYALRGSHSFDPL